jgi:hypothetical protein
MTSLALAAAIAVAGQSVNADRIVSDTSESYAPNATTQPYVANGFGGWNLDNIDVWMSGTNSLYYEDDGSYFFDVDTDYTYQGNVYDDTGVTILGIVLAKDWPVGEPAGIKIVNDDLAVKAPKPTNCIMSTSYLEEHFLDSSDPKQVLCSGPFQSHKRYKLAMLPEAVLGGSGNEKGIDLVFNVVDEEGSRDYQVFQKINNWTDGRLDGFTVQVGTGTGTAFVPASDEADGVGVEKLSLSVPSDIWDEDQLAVFSIGLFGPPDPKHDRPDGGFFDKTTRAGFSINEYENLGQTSGQTDILTSGDPLPSAYGNVPPGGDLDGQFGAWLSNNMLPHGIFWDDDGNPETDAALLAWYGFNPASGEYTWMTGLDGGFAPISDEVILEMAENLEYTQGEIDDLVNVGLNYVVTVGDLGEAQSFTIRVTPSIAADQAVPGYVGKEITPSLVFSSSDGVVTISPYGTFEVGSTLTARVGDKDLNLNPAVADTVDVTIAIGDSSELLTLVEQGEDRGVFAATLPEAYGEVLAGTVVSVTYTDAYDGLGGTNVEKIASTTATDGEEPPPPVNVVSIADFSVPDSLFVGRSGKVSVTVANARESEAAVSGEVIVAANGVEVMRETFTDLGPNTKDKFPIRWTAEAEGDVYWTAVVVIDEQNVDNATDMTSVTVKPGKNNNIGNK